jgi:ATP/maltotriose-dependent transcriptional regulator MalT
LPSDPSFGEEFTGYSPSLGLLCAQGWILARLGRLEESVAVCERAEYLAREHGDNEVLTWLQLGRIEMDVSSADPAAAAEHARAASGTAEKSTTPQSRMAALVVLGVARRLGGQWDEAVAALEEAQREVNSGVNRMFEGWVRAELAMALLGRGELDRAEQEAQAAATVAREQYSRCDEIRAQLTLVLARFRRGDAESLARAEQSLVRAQELIGEFSAKAYQPEVHECRARLATLGGDTLAAERELEEARLLYVEMGATAQVERLAQELRS